MALHNKSLRIAKDKQLPSPEQVQRASLDGALASGIFGCMKGTAQVTGDIVGPEPNDWEFTGEWYIPSISKIVDRPTQVPTIKK